MDPKATLAALHEFCIERFGVELALRVVSLARPGFELTKAAPGEAAGHSRFGGRAMLEPGTPWPNCEGSPMSLFAVLDTDALAPWLGDLLPAGAGLLNFFYHEELALEFFNAPEVGAVIAARSGHAVETDPPAGSTVFAPVAWAASPGFAFPDTYDPAWYALDVEPGAYDRDSSFIRDYAAISNIESDWHQRPGALFSEDSAFGWPVFPTGSSPTVPDDEDPTHYHHLLQLSDQDEWRMGGDGGWMHWSIPTEALRAGDFSRAIPTPDIW